MIYFSQHYVQNALICQRERHSFTLETMAFVFKELNGYVNMHERDSRLPMKFVINIFKTDIEQTNSTLCKCIPESDGKFSICTRIVIDDLDIRVIYLSFCSLL